MVFSFLSNAISAFQTADRKIFHHLFRHKSVKNQNGNHTDNQACVIQGFTETVNGERDEIQPRCHRRRGR